MPTAPSLRGTPTNVSNGSKVTSLTGPAIPTGATSGADVLVLVVLLESGTAGTQGTVTTPSGWTTLGTRATTTETSGQNSCSAFWQLYGGSSIGTVTWDVSAFPNLTCFAVQGSDTGGPHKVSGFQSNAAGNFLVPSVATTIDNCFLVALLNQNWGMNGAPLSGWTEAYDDGSTAIETNGTAGATHGTLGTYTFVTSTHTNMTMLLAFAPTGNVTVTAVPATATASMPAPTVTAVAATTVVAPAASATATMATPTLVLTGGAVTVTATPMRATASVPVPTVAVENGGPAVFFQQAFEAESLANPGGIVTEGWVRLYAREHGLSFDKGREYAYMMVNQGPFEAVSWGYAPARQEGYSPTGGMGYRPYAKHPQDAVQYPYSYNNGLGWPYG